MDKTNYRQTEYNKPFIIQRADPYVYRHSDGTYWFTASVPEYDRIVLRKSNTVDGLAQAEEVTIWRKHENGIMSVHIWAPEIHYVDNKWFIYFAGGDIEDIWAIRPYVLMCEGDDPLKDPWKEMGMLKRKDAFSFQDFSLDMTVFENMGQWYCVWAEKVSVGKKISNLYIARMDSPTSLATEQVLLTSPDYDWERVDFWVNEGPAVVHQNISDLFGKCYRRMLLYGNAQHRRDRRPAESKGLEKRTISGLKNRCRKRNLRTGT